jgi:hypothetical protein
MKQIASIVPSRIAIVSRLAQNIQIKVCLIFSLFLSIQRLILMLGNVYERRRALSPMDSDDFDAELSAKPLSCELLVHYEDFSGSLREMTISSDILWDAFRQFGDSVKKNLGNRKYNLVARRSQRLRKSHRHLGRRSVDGDIENHQRPEIPTNNKRQTKIR